MRIYSSPVRDFIEAALLAETDDCILWPFAVRKSSGYAAFQLPRGDGPRSRDAHRYVCGRAHGPAPEGHEAAHSCGNRLCINKRHLRWTLPIGNMADAKAHRTLRGGGRHRQRIFAAEKAAIVTSKDSYSVIAGRFGIDPAYVGRLRRETPRYDL